MSLLRFKPIHILRLRLKLSSNLPGVLLLAVTWDKLNEVESEAAESAKFYWKNTTSDQAEEVC